VGDFYAKSARQMRKNKSEKNKRKMLTISAKMSLFPRRQRLAHLTTTNYYHYGTHHR